jgi:hypothetical protein
MSNYDLAINLVNSYANTKFITSKSTILRSHTSNITSELPAASAIATRRSILKVVEEIGKKSTINKVLLLSPDDIPSDMRIEELLKVFGMYSPYNSVFKSVFIANRKDFFNKLRRVTISSTSTNKIPMYTIGPGLGKVIFELPTLTDGEIYINSDNVNTYNAIITIINNGGTIDIITQFNSTDGAYINSVLLTNATVKVTYNDGTATTEYTYTITTKTTVTVHDGIFEKDVNGNIVIKGGTGTFKPDTTNGIIPIINNDPFIPFPISESDYVNDIIFEFGFTLLYNAEEIQYTINIKKNSNTNAALSILKNNSVIDGADVIYENFGYGNTEFVDVDTQQQYLLFYNNNDRNSGLSFVCIDNNTTYIINISDYNIQHIVYETTMDQPTIETATVNKNPNNDYTQISGYIKYKYITGEIAAQIAEPYICAYTCTFKKVLQFNNETKRFAMAPTYEIINGYFDNTAVIPVNGIEYNSTITPIVPTFTNTIEIARNFKTSFRTYINKHYANVFDYYSDYTTITSINNSFMLRLVQMANNQLASNYLNLLGKSPNIVDSDQYEKLITSFYNENVISTIEDWNNPEAGIFNSYDIKPYAYTNTKISESDYRYSFVSYVLTNYKPLVNSNYSEWQIRPVPDIENVTPSQFDNILYQTNINMSRILSIHRINTMCEYVNDVKQSVDVPTIIGKYIEEHIKLMIGFSQENGSIFTQSQTATTYTRHFMETLLNLCIALNNMLRNYYSGDITQLNLHYLGSITDIVNISTQIGNLGQEYVFTKTDKRFFKQIRTNINNIIQNLSLSENVDRFYIFKLMFNKLYYHYDNMVERTAILWHNVYFNNTINYSIPDRLLDCILTLKFYISEYSSEIGSDSIWLSANISAIFNTGYNGFVGMANDLLVYKALLTDGPIEITQNYPNEFVYKMIYKTFLNIRKVIGKNRANTIATHFENVILDPSDIIFNSRFDNTVNLMHPIHSTIYTINSYDYKLPNDNATYNLTIDIHYKNAYNTYLHRFEYVGHTNCINGFDYLIPGTTVYYIDGMLNILTFLVNKFNVSLSGYTGNISNAIATYKDMVLMNMNCPNKIKSIVDNYTHTIIRTILETLAISETLEISDLTHAYDICVNVSVISYYYYIYNGIDITNNIYIFIKEFSTVLKQCIQSEITINSNLQTDTDIIKLKSLAQTLYIFSTTNNIPINIYDMDNEEISYKFFAIFKKINNNSQYNSQYFSHPSTAFYINNITFMLEYALMYIKYTRIYDFNPSLRVLSEIDAWTLYRSIYMELNILYTMFNVSMEYMHNSVTPGIIIEENYISYMTEYSDNYNKFIDTRGCFNFEPKSINNNIFAVTPDESFEYNIEPNRLISVISEKFITLNSFIKLLFSNYFINGNLRTIDQVGGTSNDFNTYSDDLNSITTIVTTLKNQSESIAHEELKLLSTLVTNINYNVVIENYKNLYTISTYDISSIDDADTKNTLAGFAVIFTTYFERFYMYLTRDITNSIISDPPSNQNA